MSNPIAKFIGGFLALFSVWAVAVSPRAVVFDVDDTLVDVNFRTLEVLHDIGTEIGVPQLVTLEYSQVSYYCSTTVKAAGITDSSLLERICGNAVKGTLNTSLWGLKFFSPEYLPYDHVMSGAPEFVNRLARETGAVIIYLTGRSETQNRAATEAQLRYYGFPDPSGALLVMKGPQDSPSDRDFKQAALSRLEQTYTIIGAFDDSKDNANMFRQVLPAAVPVVRPNRNLADQAGLLSGIMQITNYFYNVSVDPAGARTVTVNRDTLDEIIARAKSVQ